MEVPVPSGTIESCIERAYSRERVKSRVTEDHFYVGEGAEGIVAFADARCSRP